MAISSVIVVRVLGNTRGLQRSLRNAQQSLGGLEKISTQITGAFRFAAIAAAVFAASTIAAGAAGAVALAAIPAALIGVGIAFAATDKRVKSAFTGLKDHVVNTMKSITKPLVGPLVTVATQLGKAFDVITPALAGIFRQVAPLITQFATRLVPAARSVGATLREGFAAGLPVLEAFGRALTPIGQGLRGLIRELGKGSPQFVAFVGQLGKSLGQLLPALGRLLTALAPIGTVILSVLIPALVSLMDWVSAKVGPAFDKLSGAIKDHPTLFKAVGVAVLSLVVAIKVAQLAVAAFTLVTTIATTAATIIRAAIIAWKNAQFALNVVMALNPIGLVVLAVIALVAIIVIAYKKSETFRKIVDKAFAAIKNVIVKAVGFVVGFVKNNWRKLVPLLLGPLGVAVALVVKNWGRIKAATSRVWNAIKGILRSVWNAIKSVIRTGINGARAAISAAWNFIKAATSRIWNGIKRAVSTAVSGLMATIRGIRSKVTGIFSGAASWLLGAGRAIIQGLLDGIGSMIGKVKDKLAELTNLIPDLKGPPTKDKKLLRTNGELIMQGLIDGFDRAMPKVRRALAGVSGEISGLEATIDGRVKISSARAAFSGASATRKPEPTVIEIRSSGSRIDNMLVELLRGAIRSRGGDVQLVLGRS